MTNKHAAVAAIDTGGLVDLIIPVDGHKAHVPTDTATVYCSIDEGLDR